MSFRSRRSYSSSRPSSLYNSSSNSKPISSFLGQGLSQSSPYLNLLGNGLSSALSSATNGFSSLSGSLGLSLGNSPYSSGKSNFSSNYSSPYNSLSTYSSYRTPSSIQRAVSPTYRTSTSVHVSPRSFSVSPAVSRYPSFHKSRKTRSRSSSEGYASGGEKDKSEDVVSRVSQSSADQQVDDSESASENGELDYKKLYEESQVENQRLRDKLKKSDDDLMRAKLMAEKVPYVPMRNSLSEAEKREKKAMERKLSEMEEELKQLQKLKAENERLKAENRALTRVVSKLTTSHNAT